MKPLIYVAGPYSQPDPVINTRRAIDVGFDIQIAGGVPYVPHLSMFMHLIQPKEINFWYDYDIDILGHCDALYRFDGDSTGADNEVQAAIEQGIDVFYEEEGLKKLEAFISEWTI